MLHQGINSMLVGLLLPYVAIAASCNLDNVLRALSSHDIAAATFCSQLLATTTSHASLPLPTYVSQYPSSRVSSGCSCLSVVIPPTTTLTSTSSSKKVTSTNSLVISIGSSASKSSSSLSSSGKVSTIGSSASTSSLPSSPKTISTSQSSKTSTPISSSGKSSALSSSSKTSSLSTSSKTVLSSSSSLLLSFSSSKLVSSSRTSSSSLKVAPTSSPMTSTSSKSPTSSSRVLSSISSTTHSSISSKVNTVSLSSSKQSYSISSSSKSVSVNAISTYTQSTSLAPTFTGTTVQAFSSPASCYTLPVPTSSLVVASNNLTTNTQLNSPISMYFNLNSTTVYYYSLIVNGTSYLYDVTNPNQIAITSANGDSLLVNSTGFYIFGANCNGALAVNIANFTQQLNQLSNTTSVSKRSAALHKRRETSFTVDAVIEDQCGNPVTDMNPDCDVGTSPCQIQQAISGSFAWTCQFPGANAPETMCENSVNNALNYVTQGVGGQLTNIGGAAGFIAKFFPASVIGQLISRLAVGFAGLAAAEFIIDGLAALALVEIAIAAVGQDNIAYALCTIQHLDDPPLPLLIDTSYQQVTLAVIDSAPTPTFDAGTVSISDPASTGCPCVPGVCGSFNVIYSPNCGEVGDCVCVTDANGQGVCVEDVYCDSTTACATDADCPGGACWVNSCCGGAICAPLSNICSPSTKLRRNELPLPREHEKRDGGCLSGALCP